MPGPLAALPSILMGGLKAGVGTLASRGADAFADKIQGIPTPQDLSGYEAGSYARDYYDAAFPGTTAFERLGSQSPAPAEVAAKSQEKLQRRELANRIDTAKLAARAQVLSASSPYGAVANQSLLDQLEGGIGSDYDTPSKQGRDELPSKISQRSADAGLNRARTGEAAERSKQAPGLVRSEIFRNSSSVVRDLTAGLAGALLPFGISKFSRSGRVLKGINRGRIPRRFQVP